MFSLKNKIAVVTGAGSGIGKAVALLFAKQGAIVHVMDLGADNAKATVDEINANGGMATVHVCDITNASIVTEAMQAIGKFSILVNCAGIAHIGNAENTSEQDFDRVFNVNVKGTFNCIKAAIPLLKMQQESVIVNIASIAALVGITDRFAYSMSKGAVYAMTLSVARDFMKDKIRCNSISPARIHTPFVDGFIAKNYPDNQAEMFDKLAKSQPIGRMGTVEEVAALALYLASDEAGFITGCDYPIDGGFIKLNN